MSTIEYSVSIHIEIAPDIEFVCRIDMGKNFIEDIAMPRIGQRIVFSGKLTPKLQDNGFDEESFIIRDNLKKSRI